MASGAYSTLSSSLGISIALGLGAISVIVFIYVVMGTLLLSQRTRNVSSQLSPVPKVAGGLPLLGNLLQLKEKKPFKTFIRWAESYGPIYSIKLGSSHVIVLNSTDVAKEAMVTRFTSISTRKLSKALTILTYDKNMVAMSDYDDFHKMVKRLILSKLLGSNALKRTRYLREIMVNNVVNSFNDHVKSNPFKAVDFREVFELELFGLALKQAVGRDVHSIEVEEIGATLSKTELLRVLVLDMMEGAIEVDWRDFFPYMRWVPNKIEAKIKNLAFRREAVVKTLIREHKRRKEAGEDIDDCYLDYLLVEARTLTESQLAMLLWEPIVGSSDTTLLTTEWAMFELGKDTNRQDRLYQELKQVCGANKITEDHLSQLPYLNAVFHETLRKHSPVSIVPVRYAHEDTQIGGYHIPANSEIIINLYGCNRDKNQWKDPDEWIPERFLQDRYDPFDLYKTMSFGAGKRVCAGSSLAMSISCLSIGTLVQTFEWRLKEGELADVDIVGLTTRKLHPLKAILKPRGQVSY